MLQDGQKAAASDDLSLNRPKFSWVDPLIALLLFLASWAGYYFVGTVYAEKTQAYRRTVLGVDCFAVMRHMCDLDFSPKYHRSTAHPLFTLFFKRACVSLKKDYSRPVAVLRINLFFAAIGNVLFYFCLRKIGLHVFSALLFAALLALSFPHLIYGSIPETYSFASTSLILLLLLFLFVNHQTAFIISFLPATIFSAGITTTNIVFAMILFFQKIRLKKGLRSSIPLFLLFCILGGLSFWGLISLQKVMYPISKEVFASTSISSNLEFLSSHLWDDPVEALGWRLPHFFLYNIVAPGMVRNVVTFPGFDHVRGITCFTFLVYFILIALCVWMIGSQKIYKNQAFAALLAYFSFNILFFLFYGSEPHLYQSHYTFAWIAMIAFPFARPGTIPKQILYVCYGAAILLLPLLAINNWTFLKAILDTI